MDTNPGAGLWPEAARKEEMGLGISVSSLGWTGKKENLSLHSNQPLSPTFTLTKASPWAGRSGERAPSKSPPDLALHVVFSEGPVEPGGTHNERAGQASGSRLSPTSSHIMAGMQISFSLFLFAMNAFTCSSPVLLALLSGKELCSTYLPRLGLPGP